MREGVVGVEDVDEKGGRRGRKAEAFKDGDRR